MITKQLRKFIDTKDITGAGCSETQTISTKEEAKEVFMNLNEKNPEQFIGYYGAICNEIFVILKEK